MKIILQQFVSILMFFLWSTSVNAAFIDFSSLAPGDSIEGLDAVHPLLNITTSQGNGVALFEGVAPIIYRAPNSISGAINGGMSSTGGFGDISTNQLHDFIFSFATGTTITNLSLRMLDHGDYNPGGATQHSVVLEALNGVGAVIDQNILSYTSDNAINPTSGSAGNLQLTGDAVTANLGEPGNIILSVSGTGITEVRLLYSNNGVRIGPSDPNIAFDSLNVNFVPIPPAAWLLGSGLIGLIAIARRKKHNE